jgi:hypothetical protein
MGHALADRYDSPEEAIAALNRQRHVKTAAVLGGVLLAVAVMVAAAAAMYSEEPTGATPVEVVPR